MNRSRCEIMVLSETLFWLLIGAQAAFAICLGLSKLRLLIACPLALMAMLIPIIYDVHIWGFPDGGGLLQLLMGSTIPIIVRRVKQRGSLLPKDPNA